MREQLLLADKYLTAARADIGLIMAALNVFDLLSNCMEGSWTVLKGTGHFLSNMLCFVLAQRALAHELGWT